MGIFGNLGIPGDNSNSISSSSASGITPPSLNNVVGSASVLNQGNNTTTASSADATSILPWVVQPSNSLFMPYINFVPLRWDQLYPYRLLVIDIANNNTIVSGGNLSTDGDTDVFVTKGTGSAFIGVQPISPAWIIQLPITPTQLNITDQFSINTSATLRGVMEEHNGVKFKMINASGSFGVWATRPSADSAPQTSPGLLQSVFGGTIGAFNNLTSQVQSTINTATNGSPNTPPKTLRPENFPNAFGFQGTGYYRALAVQQFLEQYAESKKNPANATWRLVFDIPKQNQSFIVTPMQFTWQQNANRPMEIMYSLQFKAWRRVNLQEKVNLNKPNNQPISVGILQRILNTLSQARSAASSALNLIAAVRSDVETPLNVLRQTTLFVKDLAGVANAVVDLPSQIISDYRSSIAKSITNLSAQSLSTSGLTPTEQNGFRAIVNNSANTEGLGQQQLVTGQLGTTSQQLQIIDPSNNVFNNSNAYYNLLNQVPVSSLNLTPTQQVAVTNSIAPALVLTVSQLKQYRSVIQTLALQLSNSFGTGSAFYNKIYGLPAPTTRLQPITLDEYTLLQSLYDTMQCYDILTAATTIDSDVVQTNMEYVAGLATNSGIAFNVPTSKVLVPVPFGSTIEAIALRYLGDAQRWIEIATLNDLREPYIDENGFQELLLSNANGRQVTVADSSNLYLGQTVTLMSSTQFPTSRTIIGIDVLSTSSSLITLDGLADLGNFTTTDQAYIQAYLPGTTNSQQKIYIPSTLPANDTDNIIVPSSTSGDPLTGLSKVDLLLDDNGDIAINNYGDFRFSYGMTNIIQALKIMLATNAGSVITHPEYGLGLNAGISSADFDAPTLFKNINALIQQDPRFAGLSGLQVSLNGPTLSISLGVQLAGKNGVFPINFKLT